MQLIVLCLHKPCKIKEGTRKIYSWSNLKCGYLKVVTRFTVWIIRLNEQKYLLDRLVKHIWHRSTVEPLSKRTTFNNFLYNKVLLYSYQWTVFCSSCNHILWILKHLLTLFSFSPGSSTLSFSVVLIHWHFPANNKLFIVCFQCTS